MVGPATTPGQAEGRIGTMSFPPTKVVPSGRSYVLKRRGDAVLGRIEHGGCLEVSLWWSPGPRLLELRLRRLGLGEDKAMERWAYRSLPAALADLATFDPARHAEPVNWARASSARVGDARA